jgi:hypothetical protein
MTINGLNTVSALTAQDQVPVWDNESSGEPTRKITAQNMANSVKTLGSLVNTTEMNNAIAQSTAKLKSKEIYGTTDNDGYINLGLSDYQVPVWTTGGSQSKILRLVCGADSGSWGGFAICNAANMQVTFTCWYLDYSG